MGFVGTMRPNAQGHLEIGGCDAVDLARRFGTPLYVMDEYHIRSRCREYREAMAAHYEEGQVIYAGKALLNTAMCRIIAEEGLGLDVVSGGELYTALQARFPVDRIYFHGNNKSASELRDGLIAGVHRIVVDSMYELELLDGIAADCGRQADVYLRLTPGVEAHTHHYIRTGQRDSKFGFDVVGGVAMAAVKRALALPGINLRGFHAHIGSQIFDTDMYEAETEAMFAFMAEVRDETGFVADELDLGGGMGIRYTADDEPRSPTEYVRVIANSVRKRARHHNLPLPRLLIEPGRSIVGEAGCTIYTVGAIKEVPGIRTYVAVDGGMYENPRVALYEAKYEAVAANRLHEPADKTVSLAGKCCETGDMLIWDLKMPATLQADDIIAVLATGAYNYSMASNYNRLPRPAMVLVKDGRADIIVRREQYEDIVALDVIPTRLMVQSDGGL